ncbi:hypothetical protein MC916_004065 [Elizabethkingia anophelis]|uniref:hypothetical protein n=1 Tax=Elizabethkingia anophelis TaxID=1117645 RepID=UPI001D94D471|nr:hypothetical protein [Elizabethkingia anophelis]EHM7982812.1 hypothetical protein [Elizabethkingia anophelis]EHM8030181.1 hypothetical protein [Elizabethkingia anophelis]EHZ9532935.1 hypothetical protein [Elizabethkingia anophelis]EKU3670845.1 hypothetical protein [Elizabethkingia anophelis]EKU4208467.1 hypothetical protein [Elizabethkingia anophelis]
MNPFILSFRESPKEADVNFSKIKYCDKLNLSVDIQTGRPAISFLNSSTSTFTKVYNETSDSDNDFIGLMMETMTRTQYQQEGMDDDTNYNTIKVMMETKTITLVSQEVSDDDVR